MTWKGRACVVSHCDTKAKKSWKSFTLSFGVTAPLQCCAHPLRPTLLQSYDFSAGTMELFLLQVGWAALPPAFMHGFLTEHSEFDTETKRVYSTSSSEKSVGSVVEGLKAC